MQSLERKTDAKYDIVKFVMSLMVLALHTALYPYVLYPWLRMAVPLFLVTSSYFLFSKLESTGEENHKAILKRFVVRNGKLYAGWFVVLLPLTLYIRRELYFSHGLWGGILNFFRGLFFSSTFVASWYITASVIGVMIVYLLARYLKQEWILWAVGLLTFFLVTIESSYASTISGTALSSAIRSYINITGDLVTSFPYAILWILVGRWFARGNHSVRFSCVSIPVFLLSCVGLYLEWKYAMGLDGSYNNDSYFMLFPACTSFFATLQRIKPLHVPASHHLKKASTVIYASHGTLAPFIGACMRRLLHVDVALVNFFVTLLCCGIAYFGILYLCSRFPGKRISAFLRLLY